MIILLNKVKMDTQQQVGKMLDDIITKLKSLEPFTDEEDIKKLDKLLYLIFKLKYYSILQD